MIWLELVVTLAVMGALTWTLMVMAYAKTLLSPPRMTEGKALLRLGRMSPRDFGMNYEEVSFDAGRLGVPGWWVPAEGSMRTVVILHAFGDAKVGALAWAPIWRELGFNLLLIDLRGHGESTAKAHTAGHREANDLLLTIEAMCARWPTATREVVLFGASFGAAVASAAARLELGEQVKAIVLDSPVASFEAGAVAHARLFALPGGPIARAAVRMAERWSGVGSFTEMATVRTLAESRVPAMVIVPTEDAYVSAEEREAFRQVVGKLKGSEMWEPASPHLMAVNAVPEEYRQRVGAFGGRVLS